MEKIELILNDGNKIFLDLLHANRLLNLQDKNNIPNSSKFRINDKRYIYKNGNIIRKSNKGSDQLPIEQE